MNTAINLNRVAVAKAVAGAALVTKNVVERRRAYSCALDHEVVPTTARSTT